MIKNSFLFPKTYKNTYHLQNSPEYWQVATDEEHLEAMQIEVNRINPRWMQYLQTKRPHLVKQHLQNRRQQRF